MGARLGSWAASARRVVGTFAAVWLALAVAFACWGTFERSAKMTSVGDLALSLVVGVGFGLFYAFWPAVVVAACRAVFRAVGWAAFVPLPAIALGVVGVFWLGEAWLLDLLADVFRNMASVGASGAHAAALALVCLAIAIGVSPLSWLAMAKLLAAVVLLVMLGSLPGCVLWVVLVLRAVRRRRAAPA